jgi:hypothetical protein
MESKGIIGRRCSYLYLGYRNAMEEVKLRYNHNPKNQQCHGEL